MMMIIINRPRCVVWLGGRHYYFQCMCGTCLSECMWSGGGVQANCSARPLGKY